MSINSPWNMKSDHADYFNRQVDSEKHNKIYGQSTKELVLFKGKGRDEKARRMLSQSVEYKDLELHHLNKIKPAFHESYDFPLNGAGNRDPKKPRPYPVLQTIGKTEEQMMIKKKHQENIESKIFVSKSKTPEMLDIIAKQYGQRE